MLEKLLASLQKPVLWQRSGEPFWDDDHISKQMLEAHLDPYRDAASRRHDFIDRSVGWLANVIPAGGRVLDLGCGPGLYTGRLAGMGYDVTGMDWSRRSLSHAREHDAYSRYVYGNYLELNDVGTYDAITLIYCDYGALVPDERQTLLESTHRALKPGGLFVFDVFTLKTLAGKRDRCSWSTHPDGGFWHAGPHVCLEASYYYEENTVECSRYAVVTEDEMRDFIIWNTVYDRDTLRREVLPFGFTVHGIYDDVCGSPYTGESDTLCLVLRKA